MAAQALLYVMAPIVYPTTIRGIGVGAAVAVGRTGSIAGPKLGGALKSAGHAPSPVDGPRAHCARGKPLRAVARLGCAAP